MKIGLLILCFLYQLGAPVWADSIKLRHSLFRQYGHITQVDDKSVTMQTHNGALKTWPRALVVSLTFDEPPLAPGSSGHSVNTITPSTSPVLDNSRNNNALSSTIASPLLQPEPLALAQFKGQQTQTRYMGLYQLDNRGTCWLTLPTALNKPMRLMFNALPKWNPAQPLTGFMLTARFLDEQGRPLGTAPSPVNIAPPNTLLEWFTYLTDMSGVGTPLGIDWQVPARTKTIEWVVPPEGQGHQLVGYISQIQLQP